MVDVRCQALGVVCCMLVVICYDAVCYMVYGLYVVCYVCVVLYVIYMLYVV